MHLSIACPTVPPGRWWGFDQGGGQMYPKSPPGDWRNGQTAPPDTRGDHSADWRRVNVPHPCNPPRGQIPHPRVKRSGQIPQVLPKGGGSTPGLAIDRCISPQAKIKKNEAKFCRPALFFILRKPFLSFAIRKKVKFDEARCLFRHFCVSNVITTAHAHKSGVIFHIFQTFQIRKNLRSYDQRWLKQPQGGPALNIWKRPKIAFFSTNSRARKQKKVRKSVVKYVLWELTEKRCFQEN